MRPEKPLYGNMSERLLMFYDIPEYSSTQKICFIFFFPLTRELILIPFFIINKSQPEKKREGRSV
jgi:hypothetical protein